MMFRYLVALVFLMTSVVLVGQHTIKPKTLHPTKSQQAALSKKLETYALYQIPGDQLSDWLEEDNFELTLSLDEQDFRWSLARNYDCLSPDFTAEVVSKKGTEIMNDELLLLAYRGYSPGMDRPGLIMTLTDLGVELNFSERGKGAFRFTSLYNLTDRSEDLDVYILYNYNHLLTSSKVGANCTKEEQSAEPLQVDDRNVSTPPTETSEESKNVSCNLPFYSFLPGTQTQHSCRILQVAAEADARFIGGEANSNLVFAQIFNNIIAAELPFFTEVATSFQISRIRLHPDFTMDPYPESDEDSTDEYFDELIEQTEGEVPHDIVIGYTDIATSLVTAYGKARGISPCANKASTIMIWELAFDDGLALVNTAHEIGHTFGQNGHPYGDDDEGGCISECSTSNGTDNSFMCQSSCNGTDAQVLNITPDVTVNAWNERLAVDGGCLNNSDIGDILGPSQICNTATYSWDAINVAGQNTGSPPNTLWQAGAGLTILSSTDFGITVQTTTNGPLVSWIRMTLEQPSGCPIVLERDVVVNAMPAFCFYNDACIGFNTEFLLGRTLSGTTVDNFECVSWDCNGLNIYNYGGGSTPKLLFTGNPGFYAIAYRLSNSCGTVTRTFIINLQDCKKGKSTANESNTASGQKIQFSGASVTSDLSVYPNPVNNTAQLRIRANAKQQANLLLIDGQGRRVQSLKLDLIQGDNQVSLEFGTYPPGVYTIYTQIDGVTFKQRLIKQ